MFNAKRYTNQIPAMKRSEKQKIAVRTLSFEEPGVHPASYKKITINEQYLRLKKSRKKNSRYHSTIQSSPRSVREF